MILTQFRPCVRPFFLGYDSPYAAPLVLMRKAGGSWAQPVNTLVSVGHGWWELQLAAGDVDTLGPLAWSIAALPVQGEPLDQVVAVNQGLPVDRAALQAAFFDLSRGFDATEPLDALLQRPLFLFLQSLE